MLNSSLGGLQFGIDEDGNYGYIKAGADTVTPFSSNNTLYYTGIPIEEFTITAKTVYIAFYSTTTWGYPELNISSNIPYTKTTLVNDNVVEQNNKAGRFQLLKYDLNTTGEVTISTSSGSGAIAAYMFVSWN